MYPQRHSNETFFGNIKILKILILLVLLDIDYAFEW